MSGRGNIILIGFATSGKTTVGKLLADKIGKKFVDLDDLTYAEYNMHCDENDDWTEALFRQSEGKICKTLDVSNCVIACGGGTPMCEEFKKLAHGGTVVLLKVSAEQVRKRLGNTTRPLFDKLTVEQLREFVNQRVKYYDFADVAVDTDNKTPQEVTDAICDRLGCHAV